MAKEFWVLGLVKSGNGPVRVEVLSSEYVLPKGDVLQLLAVLPTQQEAERVRTHFGNECLASLWDGLMQVVINPQTNEPSIVPLHIEGEKDGWGGDY